MNSRGAASWARRQRHVTWSGWLILGSALVGALCSPVKAEDASLTSLLKALDLRGYPSGAMSPDFSAHTLGAGQLSLADLRGRVLVLNFWATWCLECRLEMPVLERLHEDFGPRGLTVIGINAGEDDISVRRYADGLRLTFSLALDPGRKISGLYGVMGLPVTFLVARDGRAIAVAVGPREWVSAHARALIEALLADSTPNPLHR